MEIKKREVLFGAIIVLVMLAIGIFVSGFIQEHLQSDVEKYTTAIRISDPDQFEYGMSTNIGNALVYGELSADHPVTSPDLSGNYMEICKWIERYTMHTRVVTYTDSNGNTHSEIETYYTWDTIGKTTWGSDNLTILGKSFPAEKFAFPFHQTLRSSDGDRYVYQTPTLRYYFTGLPASFEATIHADLRGGDIGESAEVFPDQSPDQVVDSKISNQTIFLAGFWIIWVLLSCVALVGFFYLENRWLDD